MKRLIPVVLFGAICFLAGYMLNPHTRVSAQGQTAPAPEVKAVNGKGMYFSIDDIKKRFPPADAHGDFAAGDPGTPNHLAWAPEYRFP